MHYKDGYHMASGIEDKDFAGRLVYLSTHYDTWLRQVNPKFKIPMANRIAKVVKVFDWDTDEGQLLLGEREKTGKWGKLDPKKFKFVLSIYFPEIIKGKKEGVMIEEVCSRYYPGTELSMFDLVPAWMLGSFNKEEKNVFKLIKK